MIIKKAIFAKSSARLDQCPKPSLPEYAFIGRSNVGKSSLINVLCNNGKLAKTSGTPGKTKIINHFLINEQWYLVDLPGYGFAKASKDNREQFEGIIIDYISKRQNLLCLFILMDSRLELQQIDAEFLQWVGEKGIAFCLVFTKADKLKKTELKRNIDNYIQKLTLIFTEMPNYFITSAQTGVGKEEILQFLNGDIKRFKKP